VYTGSMSKEKPATEKTTRDLVPGFAEMIRQRREALGWSPAQLGEKADVSFNTVYAIEKEHRAPSLRVASALVAALGLVVFLHDPAKPITAGPG